MLGHLQIPNTSMNASKICLGTGDLGTRLSVDESLAFMTQFYDAGGNFFDTAHCYAFWSGNLGVPEQIVGKFAHQVGRENVVIATKGGHVGMNGYPRPDGFLAPELVKQDLQESLERLDHPSIDLYYLHRDDPRIPVEEIMDACNELVTTGKVKALGASNWQPYRVKAANEYAKSKGLMPFTVLQNHWSLANPNWGGEEPGIMRNIGSEDIEPITELGIAVAPYTSNAQGFFATNGAKGAGTYGSEEGIARLARATKLANQLRTTAGHIALAYLTSHPFPVIPIVGTCTFDHLKESIEAVDIHLAPEQVVWLRKG